MANSKGKQPQNEDVLKNEDNLNNEDDLKNDVKQKCYQASKPEMEYNMMNIIKVALHMYTYAKMTMQSFTYIQHGSWGKGPKAQSSVLTMHPFNNFYIDKDG